MSSQPIGIVAGLQQKRADVIAANPQLAERINGKKAEPLAAIKIKQTFEKGRYIPPSLTGLIELVARLADLHPEAIRGNGKRAALVNARFCVANLAEEFAPRLSCWAIDDGMLRGMGMARWYRERHRDRIELYPEYGALYERCRAELRKGGRP